ncbi:hypothetical protein SG34_014665 [Thalassomonas viridans]|uniref:Uncharacterized protein n=1 Tax=Thalassomonas viridans TaxID=137584 RepID=A0AAE9Z773_9GAMM|nr:hypothetical protein [Thalassomonas viridans]WDE08020.1 hypothetical protein SG34_014665 [Thalassomonas viridans]
MKKLCFALSGYLLIGIICYSRLVQAQAYIPVDNAEILTAEVAARPQQKLSLAELAALLEQGQLAGQGEEVLGRIRPQIQAYYRQDPGWESAYLYARVLQREHAFGEALDVLAPVLAKAPDQVNVRLLQASILMVQGHYERAKQSCLALTGHIEIAVIAACALDAFSQGLSREPEQLAQLALYYQTLAGLLAKSGEQSERLALWSNQILAEMALRLNRPLAARQHLSRISLELAPVSLVALWADIELALGDYEAVLTRLPALAEQEIKLPDTLLLRLAIAERNIRMQHKKVGIKWQSQLAERVKLRELRRDREHAADLARYYLDVSPEPEKASYWAAVNYQQAKMASDRGLLQRAASARP